MSEQLSPPHFDDSVAIARQAIEREISRLKENGHTPEEINEQLNWMDNLLHESIENMIEDIRDGLEE